MDQRLRRAGLPGLALLLAGLPLGSLQAQPDGVEAFSEGRPPIVETLGEDRVVRLTAVNETKGRVGWFNWDLARELGIELPRGNRMTPELEAELMRRLSWRIAPEGTSTAGRTTVDVYADRYGGWGMGYNKGAGRAAFFGKYNLNIKGVGVTPLVSGSTHYSHRHGGAPFTEGILEGVWGEVGRNLFNGGSTRILAVIDVNDYTEWQDGGKEKRALIVRSGHQLRPAHILAEGFGRPKNFETLTRMMEATNTLVRSNVGGVEAVDLDASLKRLADLHARTAAEQYRYRILHGGLSPGNKSFDGGMLDLGTITSQPRTAPTHVLDYKDGTGSVRSDLRFDTENEWRARDLESFRQVMREARGKPGYLFADADITSYYNQVRQKALELQMLEAAGLKPEAARALRSANPELARDFTKTLRGLGALTNDVEMNIERSRVERGSVVDIFNALRELPKSSLNAGESDRAARAFEALKADADDPRKLERVRAESARLAELHAKVLEGAWRHGQRFYDDRAGFERSVIDRAELENRPLAELFRHDLQDRLRKLVTEYDRTGDPTKLRAEMDRLIETHRVDVENLLTSGRTAMAGADRMITGERTVGGLIYGVHSTAGGERTIRVEMPLAEAERGYRLESINDWKLSRSQAEGVTYRYSTDGWKTQSEVKGRVGVGADGRPSLLFDVPAEKGRIGAIEGAFHVSEGNWWIKDGGRNFSGYRYAIPDGADFERIKHRVQNPRGPGFNPRRVAKGPVRAPSWSNAELGRLFESVRGAAGEGALARAASLPEAERASYLARASKMPSAALVVEMTADVTARYEAETNRVRVSAGLLNAIDAEAQKLPEAERAGFRRRALGLVLGHELAHGSGIKAERVADRAGLETVNRALGEAMSEAEVRRTLQAVNARGSVPLGERLRGLLRYGTSGGRAEALARAARGEVDRLAQYRRADGTLDWKKLTKSRALSEAGSLAHFGLALFLKELAVVAATGDRARIEEFFDGLMTTDFYTHYGLFVLGARAGEVAYVRYLERYIKPRFVNGILKTNLVLATGIALPQIVGGTFEGKAFAISLTSLGLASAAVKTGMSAIKWVVDLRKARQTGTVAQLGLRASKFAKLGGWFYTAAELAVVLYFAEELDQAINGYLDLREARHKLAEAGQTFARAVGDPAATPEAVREAADALNAAFTDYRNFLYRPLHQDEAIFAARLEKVARQAKIKADERKAALDKLTRHAALRRNIERRYGSIEAYEAARSREDQQELARSVETYADSYTMNRDAHLREVYEDNRRGTPLLGGVDDRDWVVLGARTGAAGDPYGDRGDIFAGWGRDRSRASLGDALRSASENRLEAYEDERALLQAAEDALRRAGRGDQADALVEAGKVVDAIAQADRELIQGNGLAPVGGSDISTILGRERE